MTHPASSSTVLLVLEMKPDQNNLTVWHGHKPSLVVGADPHPIRQQVYVKDRFIMVLTDVHPAILKTIGQLHVTAPWSGFNLHLTMNRPLPLPVTRFSCVILFRRRSWLSEVSFVVPFFPLANHNHSIVFFRHSIPLNLVTLLTMPVRHSFALRSRLNNQL